MCRRSDGQTLEVWPRATGAPKALPLLMGAPLFRNTAGGRCVWVPWAVSESLIARTRPARGLVFPKEKVRRLATATRPKRFSTGIHAERITDEGL